MDIKNWTKNFIKYFLFVFFALFFIYFLGPKQKSVPISDELVLPTLSLGHIKAEVDKDKNDPNVRPGNASMLLFYQDSVQKTDIVFLYLHGYGASPYEGMTVCRALQDKYKANVYLPRLAGHGLEGSEVMKDITVDDLTTSAKNALQFAQNLGRKVVIVSCSTGSTLALYLNGITDNVMAQVLLSPNIDLYDQRTKLMTMPWGKQILRYVKKGDYHYWRTSPEVLKYWYGKSRIEGLITLRQLIDQTMTYERIGRVSCPTFIGFYYKDENHQDNTISVSTGKRKLQFLNTPKDDIVIKDYPEANHHVLSRPELNKEYNQTLMDIVVFLDKYL